MASRNFAAEGEEPRYGMVVFCRLTGPEEEPARIDFVKRNAPRDGALDPAIYTINRDGAGPLSIGVIVTAPEYLDPRRSWQPVSGTFVVRSSAPGAMEARFEMELRPAGQRTY